MLEHDRYLRRLIVGLSGRNMRRALEIFLEFCTSGHIGEDTILKITQSEGNYVLPIGLVTKVLLRLNKRFYSSDDAYLRNLFSISERDDRPNYFTRLMILRWLQEKISSFGPKGYKGYFSIREIRTELSQYGVEEGVFRREIDYLADARCITSEDFRTQGLGDDELVALSAAGVVHVQVMGDAYYLAAIAEDTWFDAERSARAIADRIRDSGLQYLPRTALYNASDLLIALNRTRQREIQAVGAAGSSERFEKLTDLSICEDTVRRFEKSLIPSQWVGIIAKYPIETHHPDRITGVKNFGIFAELEPGIAGLIHSKYLAYGFGNDESLQVGSDITVAIEDMDAAEGRIGLSFV